MSDPTSNHPLSPSNGPDDAAGPAGAGEIQIDPEFAGLADRQQEGQVDPQTGSQEPGSRQQAQQACLVIPLLPVRDVSPNTYNPNELTDKEFQQYVAEVRRLGRLPKPLAVRPAGSGFELMDGEHAWKAARETGLEVVPCEVTEADDFEAMLQSYKRNCHGTPNKVKLGQQFLKMMKARDMSKRALAATMNVSEGTVRNALLYAEAFELRNGYAPDTAMKEIAGLTVEQVRHYRDLPEGARDRWLDDGARLDRLDWFASEPVECDPIPPETATTGTRRGGPDTATWPEGPAGKDPASLDEDDGYPRGTDDTDAEAATEGQPQRHPFETLEASTKAREPAEITVPKDPKGLARAVWDKLGPECAAEVHDELGWLLRGR